MIDDLLRAHNKALDALIEAERAEATREERERWENETVRLDFGMAINGQPTIAAYGEDMEDYARCSLLDLLAVEAGRIEADVDFTYGWLLAARLRQALYLVETAADNAAQEARLIPLEDSEV